MLLLAHYLFHTPRGFKRQTDPVMNMLPNGHIKKCYRNKNKLRSHIDVIARCTHTQYTVSARGGPKSIATSEKKTGFGG